MVEQERPAQDNGSQETPPQRGQLTVDIYAAAAISTSNGIEYVVNADTENLDSVKLQQNGSTNPSWEVHARHNNGSSSTATLTVISSEQYRLNTPERLDQPLSIFVARPSEVPRYWEIEQLPSSATIDFTTERLLVVPNAIGDLDRGKVLLAASLEGDLDASSVETVTRMLVNEGIVDSQNLQGVQFGVVSETTTPEEIQATGDRALHKIFLTTSIRLTPPQLNSIDTLTTLLGKGEVTVPQASDIRLLENHESAEADYAEGYSAAAHTDMGGRGNQEDGASMMQVNNSDDDPVILAQVIDGMGGHDDGQIARELTLGTAAATFEGQIAKGSVKDALADAARTADAAVKAYNDRKNKNSGAAGVMVALEPKTGRFVVFHVGDSRAYILTTNGLHQVTTDHSLAEAEIQTGRWDRARHREHPRLYSILSSFGKGYLQDRDLTTGQPLTEYNTASFPYMNEGVLPRNGRLLLCSDGVWDVLKDEEIQEILARAKTPAEAAQNIVEAVKATGRPKLDNITAVVIFGPESGSLKVTPPDGSLYTLPDLKRRRVKLTSGPIKYIHLDSLS